MPPADSQPVTARPSSTVVLVREGEFKPEVLMVLRRPGDAFGDSYTFPGGVLDDNEAEAASYCAGRTAAKANASLGLATGGLDFYCAAARELFEETGVLLARDSEGDWAFSQNSMEALASDLREQLDIGALPWAELLGSHGLMIACDALHYFAFWETPICRPRRWTTRFFLAELPPGRGAQHDGRELLNSRWITAREVLSAGEEGSMTLPFPTCMNLRRFQEFRSVDELLSWASKEAEKGITKIRPVILKEQNGSRFVIPSDSDYPIDCGR
jgi:8-oxo-dGTP pyrophosphatase MutT (NUDIX family)